MAGGGSGKSTTIVAGSGSPQAGSGRSGWQRHRAAWRVAGGGLLQFMLAREASARGWQRLAHVRQRTSPYWRSGGVVVVGARRRLWRLSEPLW